MKSRLITCIVFGFLILFSCTKEIDDSILNVTEDELILPDDEPIVELSAQNSILAIETISLNGDVMEDYTAQIMQSERFISVILPEGSNISSVSFTFELSEYAEMKFSSSGLNFTGTGLKLFTVVAENGDEKTYAIKVKVTGEEVNPTPSPNEITAVTQIVDNTTGGLVSLENTTIDIIDNDIKIELPYGTAVTDLSFMFTYTETSILIQEGLNLNFENGQTNTVVLESEDEELRTYTLEVTVETDNPLSDESELLGIKISTGEEENEVILYENNALVFDNNTILIEVPFKTDISSLDFEFTLSEFATLQEGTLTENLDFSDAEGKVFTVIAQDGETTTDYGIDIVIADPTEREALLEMYNPEGILNEDEKWDLTEESDIGLWTGVTTNESGNVTSLECGVETDAFNLNHFIQYLPELQSINAQECGSIPSDEEMEGVVFENLNTIGSSLGFSNFPNWFLNQPNLSFIGYSDSGKIVIPESIGDLTSLQVLTIEFGEVETIPESISELSNLTTLNLLGNTLTSIPASLAELPNLITLDLSENPNLLIPQAICDWGEIDGHTLNIEGTLGCSDDVASIDMQMQALLAMYDENSGANWSMDLPLNQWIGIELDEIGNVIKITQTFESGQDEEDPVPIKQFDDNILDLSFLTEINSHQSGLVSLPNSIGQLESLQTLIFTNNPFEEIPASIANLPNLETLDIRGNSNLLNIPQAICDWSYIDGNTLFVDPDVICGELSSENEILTLGLFISETGEEITPTSLTIGENTIDVVVPFGTPITEIRLEATYSENIQSSTIDPTDSYDFSTLPETFTVEAQDGTPREYTITVTVLDFVSTDEQREALLRMYDETTNLWDTTDFTADWAGIEFDTEGNVVGFNFNEITPLPTLDSNLNFLPYLTNIVAYDSRIVLPIELLDYDTSVSQIESITFELTNFEITDWILELPNLKTLVLGEGSGDFPDDFGDFQVLENLTIFDNGNDFSSIPDSIGNLTSLVSLNISQNEITSIPETIINLELLEILNLSITEISEIPEFLTELPSLTTLDVSNNTNLIIPQIICDWGEDPGHTLNIENTLGCSEAVDSINAQKQALLDMHNGSEPSWDINEPLDTWAGVSVDPVTGNVTGLIFDSDISPITNFNSSLGELMYLEQISATDSRLSFSTDIVLENNLESLTNINIDTNSFSFSNWILELPNLTEIRLDDTTLSEIPAEISEIESLETLSFINMSLTSVTETIVDLPNLTSLTLFNNGNSLVIPQAICDKDVNDPNFTLSLAPEVVCEGDLSPIDLQRLALLEMYNDNGLWDLNDTTMESWIGISLDTAGNVTGITLDGDSDNVNGIVHFPLDNFDSLADLPFLTSISIYSGSPTNVPNAITELPENIGQAVPTLNRIVFERSDFTSVPESLAQLDELTLIIQENASEVNIPTVLCDQFNANTNFSLQLTDGSTTTCAEPLSDENEISNFQITGITINDLITTTNGFEIIVPFSEDVSSAVLSFDIPDGATSSEVSGATVDLESLTVITITAENGDQQDYDIVLTRAEMTQREALLSMYDAALDTNGDWDPEGDWNNWVGVTVVGENVTGINFDEIDYITLNENLGKLTFLETLNLSYIDLPTEIEGELSSLRSLISYYSNNTAIYNWITNTTSLTTLVFDDTLIAEIPSTIVQLSNLDTFTISNTGSLTLVPNYIGQLSQLSTLNLSATSITELPEEISQLTNLTLLNVAFNSGLLTIPKVICDMEVNQGLVISKGTATCELYTPEIQAQRDALLSMYNGHNESMWDENTDMSTWGGVTLDDDGNVIGLGFDADISPISSFNDSLGDLTYLRSIIASDGNFNFAVDLSLSNNLENLTSIRMENDPVLFIPNWVFMLPSLQIMSFGDVGFTEVPDQIGQITSLTSLTFNDDDISFVSEEVGNLPNLTSFTMYNNVQVMLPANLCEKAENDPDFSLNTEFSTAPVICGGISIIEQRDALLAMYNNNSNWSVDLDMSDWIGITVDEATGNVIGLNTAFNYGVITLDENTSNLPYLRTLNLQEDELTDNDNIVLVSLEDLYVSSGTLTYIPDWVYHTVSLKNITFSDSALEVIALDIFRLENLETISMTDGTPIREVSERLGYLNNLIAVNLNSGGNQLLTIPQRVCDLVLEGVSVNLDSNTVCQ